MRIVHMITRLIVGGAQENTLLTVEGLLRRGHRVLLVTGPPLGPEGELITRARERGVPLRIVPQLVRRVHPGLDVLALFELVSILHSRRPDVVHTHSSKAGILGRLAARLAGVPVVVHTVHGMPFFPQQAPHERTLFKLTERMAARWTDRFISVSDDMTQRFAAAGIAPPEKFHTILSGMEVERFLEPDVDRGEVRRELGFGPDDVVIGKVARLFELKGHDDVIDVAPALVKACPSVRFLFVGSGRWRERLEKRIRKLGLTDRFVFTGLVDPDRIPAMMHAMDVVVHCSVREGLARVLPQGSIAGRPVVSYEIDGAGQAVADRVTGRLVPPARKDLLAQALIELVRDAGERARMGSAGRAACTDRFRAEVMVDRIESLYGEALRDPAARAGRSCV